MNHPIHERITNTFYVRAHGYGFYRKYRSDSKVQQKKDWNLFRDNGGTANFFEEFDGSEKFNFGSGRGF